MVAVNRLKQISEQNINLNQGLTWLKKKKKIHSTEDLEVIKHLWHFRGCKMPLWLAIKDW